MITVQEALDKILSLIQPMGSEKVPISEALDRVMAEDIAATRDIPPFDHSGMDGYALRSEDVQRASKNRPIRLDVIENLPAGFFPTKTVGRGEAVRIMTGAPIPKGADSVVPVEETKGVDGFVSTFKAVSPGDYIRKTGGDIKKGDPIISKGEIIRPAGIGILASIGRSFIPVYQRPLVAILCTGDELVDVDGELNKAKIISSNSYTLAAQVKDCGAIPLQLGIAKDQKEEIEEKLRQGMRADVLISSAGVSVGDYDFVKDVFKNLGVDMVFWKVAMRPGQPFAFGRMARKPVFGLPGNPVSSMVSFEQFVRPSLLKMMGHQQLFRPIIEATLKKDIRKEPGRRSFFRSFVSFEKNRWMVAPIRPRSSGILRSMVKANGLIVIPENRKMVRSGEKVKVQLIDIVRGK